MGETQGYEIERDKFIEQYRVKKFLNDLLNKHLRKMAL